MSAQAVSRLLSRASRYSRSIWSMFLHLVDDALVFQPGSEVSDAVVAENFFVAQWCPAVLTVLLRFPHLPHLHVCKVVDYVFGVAVCEGFVVGLDAWVFAEDEVVASEVCVERVFE